MMDLEAQLKLQAYLDGELPAGDAADVAAWLERDAEARRLLAELTQASAALAGHETEIRLPESRDFFWSKIRHEVERQERRPSPKPVTGWAGWLRAQLVPLGGIAALVVVLAVSISYQRPAKAEPGELELTSEDMGAYTFRDQEQQMTLVWFYDRAAPVAGRPPPMFAGLQP